MIFNPITGKIHRKKVMPSNITNDSGIHTMSSRRDSAFSDSTLPHQFPILQSKRANSDYTPTNNCQVKRLTHSMDHVTNAMQDFEITSQVLKQNYGTCNGGDHSYHNCNSQNYERSRCSYQDLNPCQNLINHYQPSDPGGNEMVLSGLVSHNTVPRQCLTSEHKQKSQTITPKISPLVRLCSIRLQPTRHQTKNAILSILDDGEVSVEFLKKRGTLKKEMVMEILRISQDGMRIVIYEPENGKGVTPTDSPVPLPKQGADYIYSIENLPEKHWKKYNYAYKFVDLVKAKTPKITYYSDKAKCLLMENLKDFEVHFYEGGKVMQSSTEGTSLTDKSGNKFDIKSSEECLILNGTLEFMWNHSVQCHKHCLLLEETLNKLPSSNFPIIVGRRPSSFSSKGKENSPILTPSFAISINTTNASTNTNSAMGNSRLKEKQVTIPGIGIAIQLPNGEIKVKYSDGSQIWVDGKNQIKFQNIDGQIIKFNEDDKIPQYVMDKLQHMPKVLKHLMSIESTTRKTHSFR